MGSLLLRVAVCFGSVEICVGVRTCASGLFGCVPSCGFPSDRYHPGSRPRGAAENFEPLGSSMWGGHRVLRVHFIGYCPPVKLLLFANLNEMSWAPPGRAHSSCGHDVPPIPMSPTITCCVLFSKSFAIPLSTIICLQSHLGLVPPPNHLQHVEHCLYTHLPSFPNHDVRSQRVAFSSLQWLVSRLVVSFLSEFSSSPSVGHPFFHPVVMLRND